MRPTSTAPLLPRTEHLAVLLLTGAADLSTVGRDAIPQCSFNLADPIMLIKDVLRTVTFGQYVAEEELQQLADYFVETDQWKRIFAGEIDIVYGPKGSGKSALYGLLLARKDDLFDRNVLVVAAENPRDMPVFKELAVNSSATELEFEYLWKLYFLCLVGQVIAEYEVKSHEAQTVLDALTASGLLPRDRSIGSLLKTAIAYVRRRLNFESIETTVQLNPVTGNPEGLTGKVTLREPADEARLCGSVSIAELLRLANQALNGFGYIVWIALDRLDSAFNDNQALENRALRGLFRAYLDFRSLSHVRLKVFLRTDVWQRITADGFREATHIVKSVTINWDRELLLNLIVRRLLTNESIRVFYNVDPVLLLNSAESQRSFFYRVFPERAQRSRPGLTTIDWIISRTQDGLQHPSPREIIHLLGRAREIQIQRLEIGSNQPDGGLLFHSGVLRDALPEVSKVRLERTVYAEYPALRTYIEALREENTVQSLAHLAQLWKTSLDEAKKIAIELMGIGVFQQVHKSEYEVPHLYRSALGSTYPWTGSKQETD